MEEKQTAVALTHRIAVIGRHTGTITGVSDVLSFDEGEIILETELGTLTIKGQELHMNRLTLEQGEADIDGKIDSLVYSGSAGKKGKAKAFWGGCFGEYQRADLPGSTFFSDFCIGRGSLPLWIWTDPGSEKGIPGRAHPHRTGRFFLLGLRGCCFFSHYISGKQRNSTGILPGRYVFWHVFVL